MKTLCENIEDLIRISPVLILLYGSAACAPCHALRQRIDLWQERTPGADARYIPIEQYTELAAQRGVLSVPAVFVYIGGCEVIRESGYFSLDEILSRTGRYMEAMT